MFVCFIFIYLFKKKYLNNYSGTLRLEDLNPGIASSDPQNLISFDGFLYYSAYTFLEGRELFKTTGEPGGSVMVSVVDDGINPGILDANPSFLTAVGSSYLFFSATTKLDGRELLILLGSSIVSSPNSRLLTMIDIVPGQASSNPGGYCSSGGQLPVYFFASTPEQGEELWKSDGTAIGTLLVKDINQASSSSSSSSSPRYLTWFRSKLYFQANDGIHGRELWVSDGTAAGTVMLIDIQQGYPNGSPSYFTIMKSPLDGQDYIYFAATDGKYAMSLDNPVGYGGSQMWRSDGTLPGTQRAFDRTANDIYFDFPSLDARNYPATFTVYKDGLYLPGNNGVHHVIIPSGLGSEIPDNIDNKGSAIYIDQALVVSDIDTPPNGNCTLVLEVSKGLLIVEAPEKSPSWSPNQLKVLIG